MTDEEFLEEVAKLNKSPATQRIFDAMEESFARSWLATNPEQADQREHLFRMVQAVRGLRGSFENIAKSDAVRDFNRRLAANQSVR